MHNERRRDENKKAKTPSTTTKYLPRYKGQMSFACKIVFCRIEDEIHYWACDCNEQKQRRKQLAKQAESTTD